jgi:hypothetical protein
MGMSPHHEILPLLKFLKHEVKFIKNLKYGAHKGSYMYSLEWEGFMPLSKGNILSIVEE